MRSSRRPARVTHPAYPLEDGFAFEALSGGLVYVKVVDTDYSNYAIVLYTYKGEPAHVPESP